MTTVGEAPQPPPGWYPDPHGQMRWWDGSQWTAQTQFGTAGTTPSSNTKTMAVLAHLGGIIGGLWVPLVIYFVDGGKDRFVRHNAAEALNFQLTVMIGSLLTTIPMFLIFIPIVSTPSGSTPEFPAGLVALAVVVIVFAFALSILNLVWSIMGMVRANRMEYWRYPVRIRFVKGSIPESETGDAPPGTTGHVP